MMTEEEKNKLKQDIKDDHTATAEELLKIKYEHPVSAPSEEYPHVGNWYLTGTDISNATLKKELREISQKHPDKLISHNAIELHQINSKKDDIESLSRYSTSTKKIRLHTYGEEYKQDLLKDKVCHPEVRVITGQVVLENKTIVSCNAENKTNKPVSKISCHAVMTS